MTSGNPAAGSTTQVRIVLSSDVHGRWSDDESGRGEGSLSRIASYVAELRAENEHVVWIDAGDLLQGTPLAAYAAGKGSEGAAQCAAWLNRSGINMAVPGNHDFDYGREYLESVMRHTSFPWLAGNVQACHGEWSEWANLTHTVAMKAFGPFRIAFIGITTRVPMWQHPRLVEPLLFDDEVRTATAAIAELRSRPDAPHAIVLCYHGGLEDIRETNGYPAKAGQAENQGLRMLSEIAGIDVLLTGHQHSLLCERVNRTLVVQPGSYGAYAADVVLEWRDERLHVVGRLVPMSQRHELPGLSRELEPLKREAYGKLHRPLCRLAGRWTIESYRDVVGSVHPFIAWMHETQLAASGAELSAAAYSGIESIELDSPRICEADIRRLFPYDDKLVVLEIDGMTLMEALDVSVSWYAQGSLDPTEQWKNPHLQLYQFAMFHGIAYTVDLGQSGSRRLSNVLYRGQPLQRADRFRIVMTEFMAYRADRYPMFRKMPVIKKMDTPVIELLIRQAAGRAVLEANPIRNWHIVGGEA